MTFVKNPPREYLFARFLFLFTLYFLTTRSVVIPVLTCCVPFFWGVEARCFHSNWVKLVTVWHTPLRLGSYEDPLGSEQ